MPRSIAIALLVCLAASPAYAQNSTDRSPSPPASTSLKAAIRDAARATATSRRRPEPASSAAVTSRARQGSDSMFKKPWFLGALAAAAVVVVVVVATGGDGNPDGSGYLERTGR